MTPYQVVYNITLSFSLQDRYPAPTYLPPFPHSSTPKPTPTPSPSPSRNPLRIPRSHSSYAREYRLHRCLRIIGRYDLEERVGDVGADVALRDEGCKRIRNQIREMICCMGRVKAVCVPDQSNWP